MNIVFYSNLTTKELCVNSAPELKNHKLEFIRLGDICRLKAQGDAEVLIVDSISDVGRDIISAMPRLKLIMSEGVGYQGIDTACAAENGIPVCNNKGVNDTAVAETAVMLILACLKSLIPSRRAVYEGRQAQAKAEAFGKIKELGECTVGLVGFGDIAKTTALRLSALGAKVLYTNRTLYENAESDYGACPSELDSLLERSDFVSLHLAANSETVGIADSEFFAKMKKRRLFD